MAWSELAPPPSFEQFLTAWATVHQEELLVAQVRVWDLSVWDLSVCFGA